MKRFVSTLFKISSQPSIRSATNINSRAVSTLVLPNLVKPEAAPDRRALLFRHQRREHDRSLEDYWISGQRKCKDGKYGSALIDFQTILSSLKGEEINNLTPNETLLLAKAYTQSAHILNVGTNEDEELALDYLDKALELVPDLQMAQELKQSILADNAISPEYFN